MVAGPDVMLSARLIPHGSQDRVIPLHKATLPLHLRLQELPGGPQAPLPSPVSPRVLFFPNHMDHKHVAGTAFPVSPAPAGEKGSVCRRVFPRSLGSINRSAWGVPSIPSHAICSCSLQHHWEGRSQWHSFAGLEQTLQNPIEKP